MFSPNPSDPFPSSLSSLFFPARSSPSNPAKGFGPSLIAPVLVLVMRKKASSPSLFKCLNRFQYPDAHTYEQVIEVNRTQGNCGQDQPRTGKGGGEEGIGLPADRATGSGRSTQRPAAAQGRAVTADEV